MTIEKDKVLHFLVGLSIACMSGLVLHNLYAGFVLALFAEVCKIVIYDIPRTAQMDWNEKAMDMVAQISGAFVGCLVAFLLTR